jgi:hypothetical protein
MTVEKFEFKKEKGARIPIGNAGELIKAFEKKKLIQASRETLPLFEKVKNEVLMVNRKIYFPFKLKEGEECDLGLFLKSKSPILKEGKEQKLETWEAHGRSALLGRIIFRDEEGRFYRDIDLKGIGYIDDPEFLGLERPGGGYFGLRSKEGAEEEWRLTEEFLKEGIRTYSILAIIALKEIIYKNEKIPIEKAKKEE